MPTRTSIKNAVRALAAAAALGTTAQASAEGTQLDVRWLGGATMELTFGSIKILTDPVLGTGKAAFRMYDPNTGREDVEHARLTANYPVSPDQVDLVLVSHDHADHLDEVAVTRLRALPFSVPTSQRKILLNRGLTIVTGMTWGETETITKGEFRVKITALPALHSEVPEVAERLGDVNGYWLEFSHGDYRRTLYWSGDSFPAAARLQPAYRNPDLLILHLGAVGRGGPFGQVSMGAVEAMAFAAAVSPRAVLPIHHSTFSLYREPVGEFVEKSGHYALVIDGVKRGGAPQPVNDGRQSQCEGACP